MSIWIKHESLLIPTPLRGVSVLDVSLSLISHCLTLIAVFNWDRKLECPERLKESRISPGMILFTCCSLFKLAPHISQSIMLVWLIKVHTLHTSALSSLSITTSFASSLTFCRLTPHNSHFKLEQVFEKKQIGQAQTLFVDVAVAVFCDFSSWRMILGDERKKPAF